MSWLGRMFSRTDSVPNQKQLSSPRADGWSNVITGLNTLRDKRLGAVHETDVVTDDQVRELWRGNWLVKRVIETLPKEAMRRGYRVKVGSEDDPEVAKEMADEIACASESLALDQRMVDARKMRRAYGGCALMPVLQGAIGDWGTPLDESKITGCTAIQILEPRELMPDTWYRSLADAKFGQPQTYRVMPITTGGTSAKEQMAVIHESRLVIFQGTRVTRLHQAGTRIGWGDNSLTPIYEVLRDFGQSWGAASALLQDFAQAVLKIDGLASLMVNDQDKTARDRIAQIDIIRSFMKMVVIDSKDDFERKTTPLSGLAEILREMATVVAAAADMPVTLLMGMSPAGLNATGESDRVFHYDRVTSEQHDMEPQLEQLLRMAVIMPKDGPCDGIEPEMWGIDWRPLWSPTDKEQAETRYIVAQADDLEINNGTITSDEAAHSHFGGGSWSMDIQLDKQARDAMAALPTDPMAAQAMANGAPVKATKPGATTVAATAPVQTDAGAREVAPAPPAPGRIQVKTNERTPPQRNGAR